MPFDPADVPAQLVVSLRAGDVVPLIGAGFSKQADSSVPSWTDLLMQMTQYVSDQGYVDPDVRVQIEELIGKGQFLMAAQHLVSVFPGDEYLSFLEAKYRSDAAPSSAHTLLWELQPRLVLTTNYDRFLERSFAQHFNDAPTVFTYKQAEAIQRDLQSGRLSSQTPVIFKVHGTIDAPAETILTESQYRQLIYREPGYRLVLSALFLTRVILMIGFSAEDPELRLVLENQRESLKYLSAPDYAFMPIPRDSVLAQRLRQDFGVQVIPYEASDGHPEVSQFLQFLADEIKT
ncbi:MAG TPA: SIR2 family protein [Actinomycetota bacterium]|nr:SIR2 family protein [Actinomycetota bacterium]